MASTKDGRKRVYVEPHTRKGAEVPAHYRTPPCPAVRHPPTKR